MPYWIRYWVDVPTWAPKVHYSNKITSKAEATRQAKKRRNTSKKAQKGWNSEMKKQIKSGKYRPFKYTVTIVKAKRKPKN